MLSYSEQPTLKLKPFLYSCCVLVTCWSGKHVCLHASFFLIMDVNPVNMANGLCEVPRVSLLGARSYQPIPLSLSLSLCPSLRLSGHRLRPHSFRQARHGLAHPLKCGARGAAAVGFGGLGGPQNDSFGSLLKT